MKNSTYTGINGKTVTIFYDEDKLEWDFGECEKAAFQAFGAKFTESQTRRTLRAKGEYFSDVVLQIIDALREVGGLWIGFDLALIEGKGVVIANSDKDPALLKIWRERIATEAPAEDID